MNGRPHLSASQLSMLARCQKQYEFRYVEGVRSPPGVALIVGKGTHKPIEMNLRSKMEWGALLSREEVQTIARDATAAEWEREEPIQNDGDPDKGGAIDQAVALATVHHTDLAPSLEPIAVEQGFTIELDGFPHDLVGYIDVETPTHVRDTKTAAKSPSQTDVDRSLQLTIYHLDATLRGEPKALAIDALVKTKTPKVVTLETSRTREDHEQLFRRLEIAARVIKSGVFAPTDPTSWVCSPKFCGYWDRCAFGARQQTSVGLIDRSKLLRTHRAPVELMRSHCEP